MLVFGLTGGIGTGKSTVAAMLAALGAAVIDADQVVHEEYARPGPLRDGVVAAFGEGILDAAGAIDRRMLGEIVFHQPEEMRRLNSIVHPRIYGRIKQRLEELAAAGTAVAVVEVPLLIEAGWRGLVDQVWVTVASPQAVTERLQKARGLTPQQIQERVQAQMSDEARVRAADVVIDTNGSFDDVRRQVGAHWATLIAGAQKDKGAPDGRAASNA